MVSHSAELKAKRKAQGLCVDCGRPAEMSRYGKLKTRCAFCSERERENSLKRYHETYRFIYRQRRKESRYTTEKWDIVTTCPECKIQCGADYWYCPWCGQLLANKPQGVPKSGRLTGRPHYTIEARFVNTDSGAKRCRKCGQKTCRDYWFCPWCGEEL